MGGTSSQKMSSTGPERLRDIAKGFDFGTPHYYQFEKNMEDLWVYYCQLSSFNTKSFLSYDRAKKLDKDFRMVFGRGLPVEKNSYPDHGWSWGAFYTFITKALNPGFYNPTPALCIVGGSAENKMNIVRRITNERNPKLHQKTISQLISFKYENSDLHQIQKSFDVQFSEIDSYYSSRDMKITTHLIVCFDVCQDYATLTNHLRNWAERADEHFADFASYVGIGDDGGVTKAKYHALKEQARWYHLTQETLLAVQFLFGSQESTIQMLPREVIAIIFGLMRMLQHDFYQHRTCPIHFMVMNELWVDFLSPEDANETYAEFFKNLLMLPQSPQPC